MMYHVPHPCGALDEYLLVSKAETRTYVNENDRITRPLIDRSCPHQSISLYFCRISSFPTSSPAILGTIKRTLKA